MTVSRCFVGLIATVVMIEPSFFQFGLALFAFRQIAT